MDRNDDTSRLTLRRATELLEAMRGRRIVVYGDVMLDEFVWGEVSRISPEAPVPVVDVRRESIRLGGAANVLANLCALGAAARVVGVVGADGAAEKLKTELRRVSGEEKCDSLIVDDARPTTIKTRIIAHNQLVVRADRERRACVGAETETKIIEVLRSSLRESAALIVSDYDKGAITPRVLEEILVHARELRVPVLIDPKIRNFDFYKRVTLVTPNHHEALRLTNSEDDTDAGVAQAARKIRARLQCDSVLVTRGERGMTLLETDDAPVFINTTAREVYDVTGAGDTVIATLAASLAAGAALTEAATLANHAAGIVVAKLGTATANAREVLQSIEREARDAQS